MTKRFDIESLNGSLPRVASSLATDNRPVTLQSIAVYPMACSNRFIVEKAKGTQFGLEQYDTYAIEPDKSGTPSILGFKAFKRVHGAWGDVRTLPNDIAAAAMDYMLRLGTSR